MNWKFLGCCKDLRICGTCRKIEKEIRVPQNTYFWDFEVENHREEVTLMNFEDIKELNCNLIHAVYRDIDDKKILWPILTLLCKIPRGYRRNWILSKKEECLRISSNFRDFYFKPYYSKKEKEDFEIIYARIEG